MTRKTCPPPFPFSTNAAQEWGTKKGQEVAKMRVRDSGHLPGVAVGITCLQSEGHEVFFLSLQY
jgi:hypothetical protein